MGSDETEADYIPPEDDSNFKATVHLGIKEIRLLYNYLVFFTREWPGYAERPVEEQPYLNFLKQRLFAIIMEYNMQHKEAEKGD